MLQSAQSTAARQIDDHARSSEFDDIEMHQYLVRNTNNVIDSLVVRRTESQTTGLRELDFEKAARPSHSDCGQDSDLLRNVGDLPRSQFRASPSVTFHALQEWEGYVTEISDKEFNARLTDLTSGAKYASEEASIPLDEISDDDADKMQVGCIFRWVIGYERNGRTKKRVSQIVFRDLPMITKSDLRDGRKWAQEIMAAFEE